MKRCEEMVPLLGPLLDGALEEEDRALVDDHLRGCAPCRDRQALIRAQAEALRAALASRMESIDLGGLSARVMARVQKERRSVGERVPVWGREMWWHRRALTAVTGLALAASVALAVVFSPARGDDDDGVLLADNSPQIEEVDFGTRNGAVLQLPQQTTVIWMSDDRAVAQ